MKWGTVLAGMLALAGLLQADNQTNSTPKAGTREFYDANIKGRYYLKDGKMTEIPTAPDVETVGGTISLMREGMLVLENDTALPSGAIGKSPSAVILIEQTNGYVIGNTFVASNAAYSGTFTCQTTSGREIVVKGYRLFTPETVADISYEQYAKVFQDDMGEKDPVVTVNDGGYLPVRPRSSRYAAIRRAELERERARLTGNPNTNSPAGSLSRFLPIYSNEPPAAVGPPPQMPTSKSN
jgi:hypothetical protein